MKQSQDFVHLVETHSDWLMSLRMQYGMRPMDIKEFEVRERLINEGNRYRWALEGLRDQVRAELNLKKRAPRRRRRFIAPSGLLVGLSSSKRGVGDQQTGGVGDKQTVSGPFGESELRSSDPPDAYPWPLGDQPPSP